MTAACPAHRELERLLAGRMNADEETALESHVSGCAACQTRLDQLTTGKLPLLPLESENALGQKDTLRSAGVLDRVADFLPIQVRLLQQELDLGCGGVVNPPAPPSYHNGAPAAGPRFTVLKLHAEGGLGRVHLARDEQLRRPVALKEIRPERADDPRVRRRFLNEAEITGQLEHPGIVPIYALEYDDAGRPTYAMRFIQGRTLGDAFDTHHRRPTDLGLRELLQRFISVCQTVAYAHSKGVIHRDLKPDNVMLGDYGETLVVDWGLAKRFAAADSLVVGTELPPAGDAPPRELPPTPANGECEPGQLTVAGMVMGTPAYMAPEQARGEPLSPAVDVYALGAVLFTLLTGKVTYEGASAVEILRKVVSGGPPNVTGVPRALNAIYFKAMAGDPRARYTTATELARDVERWLADEPVGAHREPWRVRTGRWARRHRTLVSALSVATVLLVVTGLGVAWWQGRVAQERRFEQNRQAEERQVEQARTGEQIEALLGRCEAAVAADDAVGARLAVGDAEKRAETLEADHLKDRLARCRTAADLLTELDRIDDLRWDTQSRKVKGGARAMQEWPRAFARLGVIIGQTPPTEAAAAVNGSPVRDRLLASLDLWLVYTRQEDRAALAAVLAAADPDPFRDAFRAAVTRWDVDAIKGLAVRDEVLRQPVGFAVALVSIIELPQDRMSAVLGATARARPRSFAVLMTAGKQYRINDSPTAAERIGWFRSAVTVRPGSCVAHDNLGVALWDRGDVDGAIAEFRTAVLLDPRYATVHSNLAVALSRKGDVDGAIAEYRTAIQLDPDYAVARYNLGVVLARKGDEDGAIAEYRAAIQLDPRLVPAHINLGSALQSGGDVDGAVAEFRTAILLDPKHALAHYNLGDALKAKGDLDGAIAAYREADRLGRKDVGPHLAEVELWKKLLPQLDGITTGTAEPANTADAVAFAKLCRQPFLKRHAASARLYATACTADQKYANDVSTIPNRYDAARSAALAGCGQGSDAPSDASARAALRGQALAWLETNQKLLVRRLATRTPGDQKSVVEQLSACLVERDLAGVRPGAARGGWSPSEAAAWDAHWTNARALLAMANEAPRVVPPAK